MANAMDANVRKGSKTPKCERTFIDNEGAEHARSFPGVAGVKLHFVDNGEEMVMNLSDLSPEMIAAAAAFGLNTSVGNTFGAIEDPDEALDVAMQRWETLKGGQWTSDRVTGPRIGDLLDAACRWRIEQGKEAGDAFRASLTEKLSDPAYAKAISGDPAIAVHVAAIRKERAEVRLRDRQAKGGTGAAGSLLDL